MLFSKIIKLCVSIGIIVFFCALSYLIPQFVERLDSSRRSKKERKKMKGGEK